VSRKAAESVERFDPEGGNSPGGEWRQREQPGEPVGGRATGLKRGSCSRLGQTSGGRGAEGGPGAEAGWQVSKYQARAIDPGMEALERGQPLRARERPVREAGSVGKRNRGEPGGIDPGAEKSALGERNGEAPGTSRCVALYRACRWRAKLGIGSLGTIFFFVLPPSARIANVQYLTRPDLVC